MPERIKYHPQHTAMLPVWEECRNFAGGEDLVKEHDLSCGGEVGVAYLVKKSSKQTPLKYARYVDGAVLFEGMALTVRGLKGLVFARDPDLKIPTGAEALVADADLQGTPLKELAEKALEEILITGRGGILVDHTISREGLSKLDEDKELIRPYMSLFAAEDIISWRFTRVGSIQVLTELLLKEEPEYDEEYNIVTSYLEYKILDIKLPTQRLQVIRITEAKDEKGDVIYNETILATPKRKKLPIDFIPFFFFSVNGTDWTPAKPPLYGLVKINRAHYRNSAQLEHGLDYCGNPSPVLAGFPELFGDEASGEEKKDIEIDSSKALVTRESTGKWGYLEFTGTGLMNIERALDRKESMMAKLGSRMLYENKKSAEAAEALKIRYSGESASLADIANVLSRTFSAAFAFECGWYGKNGLANIHLNTDYITSGADANEINVLWQMFLKGGFVAEDLVRRLKTVGIIGEDRDVKTVIIEMQKAAEKIRAQEEASLAKEAAAKAAVSIAKDKTSPAGEKSQNSRSDGEE